MDSTHTYHYCIAGQRHEGIEYILRNIKRMRYLGIISLTRRRIQKIYPTNKKEYGVPIGPPSLESRWTMNPSMTLTKSSMICWSGLVSLVKIGSSLIRLTTVDKISMKSNAPIKKRLELVRSFKSTQSVIQKRVKKIPWMAFASPWLLLWDEL